MKFVVASRLAVSLLLFLLLCSLLLGGVSRADAGEDLAIMRSPEQLYYSLQTTISTSTSSLATSTSSSFPSDSLVASTIDADRRRLRGDIMNAMDAYKKDELGVVKYEDFTSSSNSKSKNENNNNMLQNGVKQDPSAGRVINEDLSTHTSPARHRKLATTIDYYINDIVGVIDGIILTKDDSFRWNITPSLDSGKSGLARHIRFTFENIHRSNTEIRVYDTNENTFPLWTCTSTNCGLIPPPTLQSKSGTIILRIYATADSTIKNPFRMTFTSIAKKYNNAVKAITVKLFAGYDKIAPFLINGKMPNSTSQIWNITTPKLNPIIFSFSNFKFGSNCISLLEIYDGAQIVNSNLKYRGCIDSDFSSRWIEAPSGRSIVRLINSQGIDQELSFLLTYRSDTTLWSCGSYVQPDVLNDRTMQLSDGSDAFASVALPDICKNRPETCSDMRPGDCVWLIQPELPGSTITLFLRRVSIKSGGEIKVFDGNNASGFILWDYAGSKETYYTIPPPITSTGSSLYVTYISSGQTGTTFRGFLGEYMSNYPGSRGVGSGETHLSMATVFDLTPPGYDVRKDSPMYTTDLVYYWFINVPNARNLAHIIFSFSDINLLGSGDSLVIYDGSDATAPVLATLNGSQTPYVWYQASKNIATLKFTSKAQPGGLNSTKGGFKLNYFIDGPNYHCGFTTNPLRMTASSMIFTDGSLESEDLYKNQYCEWVIEPIKSTGVYIFFNYFQIVGGSLDVYIGDPLTGVKYVTIAETAAIPSPIYLPYPKITLVYSTTAYAVGKGFQATYFGISDKFAAPGDNVIRLTCSSIISMGLANPQALTPGSDLYFHVVPEQLSKGKLFFFINSFRAEAGNQLKVLSSDKSQVLATIDASSVPSSWLVFPPDVYLQYHAATTTTIDKTFDLSFYSDGPNNHCGFLTNPAVLVSTSMIFTDGSPSNGRMYANEYCEWIIKPEGTGLSTLVLEFLESDLREGLLTVYDGRTNKSDILWRCDNCQFIPHQLIASGKEVFIQFSTSNNTQKNAFGSGFKALFYTITKPKASWQSRNQGFLLENPIGLVFDDTPNNQTAYWALQATKNIQRMQFAPYISNVLSSDFSGNVLDGRLASYPEFESLEINSSVCGFLMGDASIPKSMMAEIVNDGIILAATQMASTYLSTNTRVKSIYNLSLSKTPRSDSLSNNFYPARSCKYLIDNEFITSFTINLKHFYRGTSGRLQIYTGIKGDDYLAFDSLLLPASKTTIKNMNIVAPCGRATIILSLNETAFKHVDYDLDMTYSRNLADAGQDCAAYIKSLHPTPPYVDPWLYYKLAGGAFGLLCCVCICAWMFRRRLETLCKALQFKRARVYTSITPLHPKYTPRIDSWKNKWLMKKGTCVVCQEESKLLPLHCKHLICLDCLKGYIDTALGDISMFPVKCPMHHAGCKGNIESDVAKRVLSEPIYEKFIEFSDRSIYGEGMRCVFCNNFVNFPSQQGQACVECPYCVQRFCIRCRKPWHYTSKCPLEKVDDSLEAYQANSKAQKCPACLKLIEKDDDGTCNHMIHKITDGIPCIRDRVDFCYLCGEEVTGDYPHEEVSNRGVNHFPDGVFQKCRIIAFREKEEERERLLRIRRMKNKHVSQRTPNKKIVVAPGLDGFDDLDDVTTRGSDVNSLILDKFDDTWDKIANSSPSANGVGGGGGDDSGFDESLLQAAMFDDNNGAGDADYFKTLNTDPNPASSSFRASGGNGGFGGVGDRNSSFSSSSSEMIVTSPQQRRVQRPQRIRVPVAGAMAAHHDNNSNNSQQSPASIGNVPASVRSGTPSSSFRGPFGGRNSNAEYK